MRLWYEQSAAEWMQALPIGNGRLGAMIVGAVQQEQILLDEETIWAGHPFDNNQYDAPKHLDEIRQLLFSGQAAEAKEMAQKHFTGGNEGYGTHLRAGELVIETDCLKIEEGSYKRQLDLTNAMVSTEYASNGVRYRREAFASYVDNVVVLRFDSDTSGSVNLKLSLKSDRENIRTSSEDEILTLKANCHDGGVKFGICVKPVLEGGTLHTSAESLEIKGANAVTLLLDINSSFRSAEFLALCHGHIQKAGLKSYAALKNDHMSDYQALFNRVSFSLGQMDRSDLPTDVRLKEFQNGQQDNGLITDFFQYGRCLTIASSRSGTLPSHLQGKWNDNKASMMGWTCDYHLDINTQMNYWPAEVCNLAECHEPAFDFMESLVHPGRITAKAFYDCPGWVAHVFTNLWGFTPPGYSERWGLHITGGVWMALHFADRYHFAKNESFLRERAYPILKEAAEFFLAFMTPEPEHGWLVTCPSSSPENVYRTSDGQEASVCAGPTCDNILVRELFAFCIQASEILNVDPQLRDRWQEAFNKIPPYQIAKDGRLQEWLKEYDEPEPNHRHTTHLLGLFPFRQITPEQTPDLAKAARKVLEYKMSLPDWEDTEWCRAWNICFYARLQDAQMAYENIRGLLNITDKNLLTFSPPHGGAIENIFVLDGNAGGTAGIAEMLMQSHDGMIHLLPALPDEWPTGTINGLRARGGYEIDIEWDKGCLTNVEIRSHLSDDCQIKYQDEIIEMHAFEGQALLTKDGFKVRLLDMRKKD